MVCADKQKVWVHVKLIREIKACPIKNEPIKYAEGYQLQEPTQFGSKKSKRRGTKDDRVILD